GGAGLAAVQRLFVRAGAHQHAPSAWPRVALAGAVGPHFDLLAVFRIVCLHCSEYEAAAAGAAANQMSPGSAWRLTATDAARARLRRDFFQAGPISRMPATRLTADTT